MSEFLDLARSVALDAADLAARRRREGVEVAATKSTIVDVVTEADREVERLVIGRLLDARPQDGVLGEEGSSVVGSSGYTWVVDPIDGTVNYLYGFPHYAVSIGLVEGDADPHSWRALAGAVVNPATGECYTATAGGGASLGERLLRAPEAVPLELALVGTGFAYRAETRARQGEAVARLLPRVRDIRRMGTASLDFCAVATGRLNAYFERTLSPWDHAAGALIAREAGAVVSGRDGSAPSADSVIVAAPGLHEELSRALDEVGAFDYPL